MEKVVVKELDYSKQNFLCFFSIESEEHDFSGSTWRESNWVRWAGEIERKEKMILDSYSKISASKEQYEVYLWTWTKDRFLELAAKVHTIIQKALHYKTTKRFTEEDIICKAYETNPSFV